MFPLIKHYFIIYIIETSDSEVANNHPQYYHYALNSTLLPAPTKNTAAWNESVFCDLGTSKEHSLNSQLKFFGFSTLKLKTFFKGLNSTRRIRPSPAKSLIWFELFLDLSWCEKELP